MTSYSLIPTSLVAEALSRLREQTTHTLFAGYLCLQQRASFLGQLTDLRPEFLQFYKNFFEVKDHPFGTPYIKIFTEQKPSGRNMWLNENVAGSYAPSSLRPNQPFRQVVSIDGKKYSLPPDHSERAFSHLLYGTPVDVSALSIVLYRDYGFYSNPLTILDVVSVFTYEFGYSSGRDKPADKDFDRLYTTETMGHWSARLSFLNKEL